MEKSPAYQFVEFIWLYNRTNSWLRLNQLMYNALELAIKGNLKFDEEDFISIEKNMRGGYWFGVNLNGKGTGEGFYRTAITENNNTAFQSYEKWAGIKPFISTEGHRACLRSTFDNNEYRYKVTGFDFESKRIYLVAYLHGDWKEEGKKKLFNFDNKEWLVFRKTVKEFK